MPTEENTSPTRVTLTGTSTNLGYVVMEPIYTPPAPACVECRREDAPNNHVMLRTIVFDGYFNTVHVCSRCFNAEYTQCPSCENHGRNESMTDEGFCLLCRFECEHCQTRVHWLDNGLCPDCGWYCEGCDSRYPQGRDSYTYGDSTYCLSCYEDLDRYEPDYDEDPDGRYDVRGYGPTHPERWFGGPLPRDESNRRVGYYLGMELEISAARMDARPITAWARENGLEGFFDCKYDGSVEGFEIATQPFTPQFFETLVSDGRLESFFAMLNSNYPVLGNEERMGHGLHVHIGRVAFAKHATLAAFAYILGQDEGKHLERIARRDPTGYCERVNKPASAAIVTTKESKQKQRLMAAGIYPGRSAINFGNSNTVEIRAFRSTRDAEELAAAIRLVYVSAEYARFLRAAQNSDPKALVWSEFCRWAAFAHPVAFASLANLGGQKKVRRAPHFQPSTQAAFSDEDFEPAVGADPEFPVMTPGRWEPIDPSGCRDRFCCPGNWRFIPPTHARGLAAV